MKRVLVVLPFLVLASSTQAQNVVYASITVTRSERDGGQSTRTYYARSYEGVEFDPGLPPWRCVYRLQAAELPDGFVPAAPERREAHRTDTVQVRCWASAAMRDARVTTDIEIMCLPGEPWSRVKHLRAGDNLVSIEARCLGS